MKSESLKPKKAVETSGRDRPKKDSPEAAEQDDKPEEDSPEQGETASVKLRKKKITVAEVHKDHINSINDKGWEKFATFRIIEVDDYDV